MRAALNPIDLDECQVNAVAARIELDLRLGASFTRFQTLTLQAMNAALFEGRVVSYGELFNIFDAAPAKSDQYRLMPIPDPWLRSRPILQGPKFCSRAVLGHQVDTYSRWYKCQFSMGQKSFVRSCNSDNHFRTMLGGKACSSHKGPKEADE